jgi:hypothetical protein
MIERLLKFVVIVTCAAAIIFFVTLEILVILGR